MYDINIRSILAKAWVCLGSEPEDGVPMHGVLEVVFGFSFTLSDTFGTNP